MRCAVSVVAFLAVVSALAGPVLGRAMTWKSLSSRTAAAARFLQAGNTTASTGGSCEAAIFATFSCPAISSTPFSAECCAIMMDVHAACGNGSVFGTFAELMNRVDQLGGLPVPGIWAFQHVYNLFTSCPRACPCVRPLHDLQTLWRVFGVSVQCPASRVRTVRLQ